MSGPGATSQENIDWSGRQDLNLPSETKNQRDAREDTPIDTLGPRQRAELREVEAAWAELPQGGERGNLSYYP
jgi:hypothetical protein